MPLGLFLSPSAADHTSPRDSLNLEEVLSVSFAFVDKTLTCRDCGDPFTFTVGEQEFYAARGYTHEPGRCPRCRAARKQRQAGYGDDRRAERGRRPSRELYSATCAACGREARVPFVPRADKPVYCSDCFQNMRSYR